MKTKSNKAPAALAAPQQPSKGAPGGKKPGKRGRPQNNDPLTEREKPLVLALYELGTTDLDIAKILNIPRSTLQRWLKSQGITGAIKRAKNIADTKVVASLYRLATGYDYTEDHVDRDGRVHALRRHTVPNVTAGIYWTCNRDPERWKSINKVIVSRPPGEADAEINAWATALLGRVCNPGPGSPGGKAPHDPRSG